MRRWLLRILLLLVLLIAVAVLVVQIILASDLPRRVAVDLIEQQTGLRVHIDSLRVRWSGRTTVRGLRIELPITRESLLDTALIEADHSNLLALMLGRFAIDHVAVDRPHIRLTEDDRGIWNVQQAFDAIANATRTEQADSDDTAGLPRSLKLPAVNLTDARISITRADGRTVRYAGGTITATADEPYLWSFNAGLAGQDLARGELSTRGAWSHTVSVDSDRLDVLIQPWIDTPLETISAHFRVSGHLRGTDTINRVEVQRAAYGDTSIRGAMNVYTDRNGATVDLDRLDVTTGDQTEPLGRVTGGDLRVTPESISATDVELRVADVIAHLGGAWHPGDRTGVLQGTWRSPPPGADTGAAQWEHSGDINVRALLPERGPMRIDAEVRSTGRIDDGESTTNWETTILADITGTGPTLLDGSITVPHALVTRDDLTADASGTQVTWRMRWPMVELTHVTTPRSDVRHAVVRVDVPERTWSADLDVRQIDLTPYFDEPIDLLLQAAGTADMFDVDVFDARSASLHVNATAEHDPSRQPPITALASIDFVGSQFAAAQGTAVLSDDAGPSEHEAIVAEPSAAPLNRWRTDVQVAANVSPLDVQIAGTLTAEQAPLAAGIIDELTVPWRASVRPDAITLQSEPFDLLGGQWAIDTEYVNATGDRALRLSDGTPGFDVASQTITLDVVGRDAAAGEIVRFLGWPISSSGFIDAGLTVTLEVPDISLDTVRADGWWTARDLVIDRQPISEGSGTVRIADGRATIDDFELREGDGRVAGQATMLLSDTQHIDVSATINNWAVASSELETTIHIDGSAELAIDVIKRAGTGTIDAQVMSTVGGQSVGRTDIEGTLDQRTIHLDRIDGTLFGGVINGSATVPLDAPMSTTADVTFADIQSPALQSVWPILGDVEGRFDGRLTLGPAGPRRPEPLAIGLTLGMIDGAYRGIPVSGVDLLAYVSPNRAVLERCRIPVSGGLVDMWGRVTRHDDETAAFLRIGVSGLSLEPLARAAQLHEADASDETPGERVIGLVNGNLTFGGYLASPHRLYGNGTFTITESDLVSLPGLSQLYSAMNVPFRGYVPTGRGSAEIRLEGSAMELTRLEYFNRGADIWATLTIEDVFQGAESPISGLAAGGVRPLRESKLPWASQLDRMFRAAQANTSSVQINGTLSNVRTRIVPLSEVRSALQRLISGRPRK